ncbi:hemerythrin domain-containing protein [Sphingomonas sp. Leaf25]|uniref:hemerythrin domain-containing protein n=1 Tax=Sphingomonas sp. Leaf25 TaxID=1735692 RepID=UPI0006FFD225|nr:hemerythrin domain-containing protein [Sphingomonas sp. Leaf25]KQM98247.1 hypothetical protein ASE78_08360 [Sphingomonas sp. Leaf25]
MLHRDRLSEEHRAIEAVAAGLLGLCATRPLDPGAVARARWQLSRLLLAHLATEDQLLYPLLERDPSPEVANLSRRMQAQMGGLADAFKAYMRDWDGTALAADPDGFVHATRAVLAALGQRIRQEESQLYRHIPPPSAPRTVDAAPRRA